MPLRLAIVVSHPIQYFSPWHRETARLPELDLHVLFCTDFGLRDDVDPSFGTVVRWDIPLLDGYGHEFLASACRPNRIGFWAVDNPSVGDALARFRPDTVLIHGYGLRTYWRVAAWTRKRRVPLMIFSDSNLRTPVTAWKRLLKAPIVRWFYRRVDGAFSVSDANRAYHRGFGMPEERIFPGVFPVDRQRWSGAVPDRAEARRRIRRRHGIPEDGFVVAHVAKYLGEKRHQDLVRAAARLKGRGIPVFMLMVGEGDQRAAIERECREQGVGSAVLVGFVNQAGLPDYYAASDVLCLPSDMENYGLVVGEAACLGLPAVVSDRVGCIGPRDAARPGENALVFPVGDVDALASALETLSRDSDLRSRMGHASERIALELDVTAVARLLSIAVRRLLDLGPRA